MAELLRNKWALVTGASSGLGEEFATQLAGMGCNLVLVARREARLNSLGERLSTQHGIEARILPMDLTASEAPQQLHDRVREQGLAIEVLINNAGFGNYGNFAGVPWEKEQALIQLNIMTPVHLTKLFLPGMIARNSGYVLMVASTAAFGPIPNFSTYAASKSFLLNWGEALNFELRKTRVRVSVVCPGFTDTEFFTSNQLPREVLYHRLTLMGSRPVVRAALRALLRGRPSLVPGLINKGTPLLARILPRRWAPYIADLLVNFDDPVQPPEEGAQ